MLDISSLTWDDWSYPQLLELPSTPGTIRPEDSAAVHKAYPAKPGYSHCAEPGRSDLHFSTAGPVKQTLTPSSDKTESGIRLYSASALW